MNKKKREAGLVLAMTAGLLGGLPGLDEPAREPPQITRPVVRMCRERTEEERAVRRKRKRENRKKRAVRHGKGRR